MDSPISEEYEYLTADEISQFVKFTVEPNYENKIDDDDYAEALREEAETAPYAQFDPPEEAWWYLGTWDTPPDVSGIEPRWACEALQNWCDQTPIRNTSDVEAKLEDIWRQVKTKWFERFNAQPYSCFFILNHLVTVCAGMSYEELLKNPMSLQGKCTEASISNTEKLSELIHLPGRCTTIVLQMADAFKKSLDLDFKFHDMNLHRIARCSKTGILLDSLLACGPIVLEKDKVEKRNDASHPQTFYYESGSSEYETVDRSGDRIFKKSSGEISREQAMIGCLRAIADKRYLEPICFFRSYIYSNYEKGEGEKRYYGMIKWRLKHREVQLIQNPKAEKNEIKMTTFVWDGKGDWKDEYHCVNALNGFVKTYGGPHGLPQWEECLWIFDMLWEAAKNLWGFPRIK